ncbi:unnamed protein product, partial [Allacma fusca]
MEYFAVVIKDLEGLEFTEAVPKTWLNPAKSACSWPDRASSKAVTKLINNFKDPEDGWKTFAVTKCRGPY